MSPLPPPYSDSGGGNGHVGDNDGGHVFDHDSGCSDDLNVNGDGDDVNSNNCGTNTSSDRGGSGSGGGGGEANFPVWGCITNFFPK